MPKPEQIKQEPTKQELILYAAMECFKEKGYHSSTLQDIANQAGISKGGLYFHYKSKEIIFIELMKFTMSHFYSDMDIDFLLKDPSLDNLKKFINMMMGEFTTEFEEMIPVFFDFWYQSTKDEKIRKIFMELMAEHIKLFTLFFEKAIQQNEIIEIDPELTAFVCFSSLDSMYLYYYLSDKKYRIKDMLKVFFIFLDGLKLDTNGGQAIPKRN